MWREWRTQRLAQDWRNLMAQCAIAAPETFPPLAPRDRHAFLELWNHHYELLRGEAQDNLRQLALGVDIAPFVLRQLHGWSMRHRLIAATTLGHLRTRAAAPELERLSRHPSAALSFAAARALMEIKPAQHLPPLLLLIAQRHDWPLSRIALALRDLGADHFSEALADAALEASLDPATLSGLPRLVHLMELAHTTQVMPTVYHLLRRGQTLGPEIIAPCLRLLNDPRQAPLARAFSTHATWYVRVVAANALRRIGDIEDYVRLMRMVSDRYWWVRYRAAQALATLPSVTCEELLAVAKVHHDKFAADMLRHVAAEASLL